MLHYYRITVLQCYNITVLQYSTPASPGGSGGHEKGKKKQNCVPVMVSEVLAAPEEGFTVEGMEVGAGGTVVSDQPFNG